jgi:hypothetical protein
MFGCEEGRDKRWSKEGSLARFHCIQLQPRVQTLNLGRATYGEIFILYGQNFYVNIEWAA